MRITCADMLAAVLLGAAAPALAAVAGTGTATVGINFVAQKLNVTAMFDDRVYDLPGINLGAQMAFSATNVALGNVDVQTGASFEVPFENDTSSFKAVGDIACPATGCTSLPGTFAFVGFLPDFGPPTLRPPRVFTFDGSIDCTGNGVVGVDCSGPFAVNAFERALVPTGSEVVITGSQEFFDPRLGRRRPLETRVTLRGVRTAGTLDVAGFSRLRGTIPERLATSTPDGFEAIYFDVATGAVFTRAEVCVVVDANTDGIVDGTSTTVSRLAGLHYVGKRFELEPIRIDGPYGCITVSSLSPFAVVASASPLTTTTTTLTDASTTTTTTTTGTVPTTVPPCATARACLAEVRGAVACPEGLPKALGGTLDKKVRAAGTKLEKAAGSAKKATQLAKRARALLVALDRKASALARKKKNGISAACRVSVAGAVEPVFREIDAGRL